MPDDKRKPRPRHLVARKLLVAAVGVATVNYAGVLACGGKEESSSSSGQPPTSGNLPAPPDQYCPPTSGNLVGPVPVDSGPEADADAGDASDADADDDGG